MAEPSTAEQIQALERYKYGFVTDIESETAPKGLSEETIRHNLEGNICRCTGYYNIVKAIAAGARAMRAGAAT